jgi:hypothetical protein
MRLAIMLIIWTGKFTLYNVLVCNKICALRLQLDSCFVISVSHKKSFVVYF